MRRIWDIGDRVCWPETGKIASEDNDRCLIVRDRDVIRHRSGSVYIRYLYDGLLERLAEDMQRNIASDYDNVVVVTGLEGSGKSTLTYWAAKAFRPQLDIVSAYAYSFQQLLERLNGDPDGSVYWLDEATNIAGNRDWMMADNKRFVQILEMMRSKRHTLYLCIPSIDRIDVYIRTFRVRYVLDAKEYSWPHCGQKGRGTFELKIPQPGNEKVPYRSVGYGFFGPMPRDDAAIYESIKSQNQNTTLSEMLESATEKKSSYKRNKDYVDNLVYYMYDVQGMDYKTISEISGIPYSTVKDKCWRLRQRDL